jgi:hypothetical protein
LNNSLNKILARCNDVFFFPPPSSQHKIVTVQDRESAGNRVPDSRVCILENRFGLHNHI